MIGRPIVLGGVALLVVLGIVGGYRSLRSSRDDLVISMQALREQEVMYFEDEKVFLVFNDGAPLALSDDAQHTGDRVTFCESARMFESKAHGEKFDMQGRYYAGPARRALDRYMVRVAGDDVHVQLDQRIRGPERAASTAFDPAGEFCYR